VAPAVTLDHRFLLEVHSNEFVKLLACLVLVALVYCRGLRLLYFVTVLGGVSHCAPGTLRNYCGVRTTADVGMMPGPDSSLGAL